jgi:probable Rubsico expression protein CbbX
MNSTPVYLQEEYAKTEIAKILNLLDEELVGLAPVKSRIREIAALLLIDKLRRNLDITSANPGLHMSFTGSPGTGKTTVGLKMADILYQLGYVEKGHLLTVTRDDLVGQYIGHTAPKTKEVLKKAMGGVLFIDEAYYLYKPDNERDYGSEAIEILLQVMENQRDDLVVILAGYKEPMDKFYESNPGLSSRITNHIDFPDYTVEELLQIAKLMLEEQQYQLTPDAEVALANILKTKRKTIIC